MVDAEADPGWKYLRIGREEAIQANSKPYDSKRHCWIPDAEEGYIGAEISSDNGDFTTVVTQRGNQITLKKELIQEMNPPKFEKTEDMANLTFLNDASVLYNLKARYGAMLIYTYSGLFCVVINPYKRLPIYTDSVARLYMSKRKTEMPPHLFSVSDEAYRNMLIDHENQSMLITGESGAGKTENTKKVIAYFAAVGAKQNEVKGVKSEARGEKPTLEDQIVQTNPILEAFGNAKTVRNNNSSRFGKFIRIHFSKLGRVASCDIEHYLLEKSRVIRQAPGERCYHIFYQVFAAGEKLREELMLNKALKHYPFVSQAELSIDGVNDGEEFGLTDEAFNVLSVAKEDRQNVYRLVSALLHMGAIPFKQRPREEQAEADQGSDQAARAAKMLGVDEQPFVQALLKPKVRVGSEYVTKGQNLSQLWINFVNEKLQQFFNHHMFVLEQEEYAREGIQWTFIDFGLDLQACIELIEKPMGIISMLDEECIVPKATDLTLAQKLVEQHLGKHPNFEKPKPPKGKQAEAHFAMRHYAGTVRYNVLNWLEKNKDPLNDTVVGVMKASKGNPLLGEIWKGHQTQEELQALQKEAGGKKKGKSGSMQTVSMLYRESLANLISMLHTTHPHFIRCIIPNEKKQSGLIDADLVLNQLTHRYALLAITEAKSSECPKEASMAMLARLITSNALHDEQFRMGRTKVFFKAGVVAHLEDLRDEKLHAIFTQLQLHVRSYLAQTDQRRRQSQRAGLLIIQRNVKSWCGFRAWPWFSLFSKVRPLLVEGKRAEEIAKFEARLRELDDAEEMEEKEGKMEGMEKMINNNEEKLERLRAEVTEAEGKTEASLRERRRLEAEAEEAGRKLQTMEMTLRKAETGREGRDRQARTLHEEITQQDAVIARATKEKKALEEANERLRDDLQINEDKRQIQGRGVSKMEQQLRELEEAVEAEKRARHNEDKERRKKEMAVRQLEERMEEEEQMVATLQKQIKESTNRGNELVETLETERESRKRIERSILELQAELDDINERLEEQGATTVEHSEINKRRENEIVRLKREIEDVTEQHEAQITDSKKRMAEATADITDQLESEGRIKAQLQTELLRAAQLAEDETHNRAEALHESRRAAEAVEALRSQLEEETAQRLELSRQLSKAVKTKHTVELNDAIETVREKIGVLEKQKGRMAGELDDAQVEASRINNLAAELEMRQKGHDKLAEKLKEEYDEVTAEVATVERNHMDTVADLIRAKAAKEELTDQIDSLRREATALQQQIRALSNELGEGGRQSHDIQKTIRRLEADKEQLQASLDTAENALEAAEIKAQGAQADVTYIRTEIEKRVREKEEEFEAARKNHERALESMQVTINTEAKAKGDMMKAKKHLESEMNELEMSVDHANKQAADAGKSLKKCVDTIRDLQLQLEEEKRQKEEVNDKLAGAQKRVTGLRTDLEEMHSEGRNLMKEKNEAEAEAGQAKEELQGVMTQIQTLNTAKRRLEGELDALQTDLDESLQGLKTSSEKWKKAEQEMGRLEEELKREQGRGRDIEMTKGRLMEQLNQFKAKLENAEGESLRAGKKAVGRMEQKVHELEADLDVEQRKTREVLQRQGAADRRVRELLFQVEEDKKNFERLNTQVEQLHAKIKAQKGQLEEAEELANTNQQKFRQLQLQLDEAEDRAETAEQALTKLRLSSRSGTSGPRTGGLQTSATMSAIGRQRNYDPNH
ncbi:unnamed protein product, partial [Mesorhabditis spiculigera]